MSDVVIRKIREADLAALLAAERAANRGTFDDPDFGRVDWFNPWTLSVGDVMSVIRQRRSQKKGTFDTRTMVVEVTAEREGDEAPGPWVCGGFAFELLDDGLELLYVSLHPECDVAATFAAVLSWVKDLVARSTNRKRAVFFLRDREEANIRTLIPVLLRNGFAMKLAPDHFGDADGWKFTYSAGAARALEAAAA